MQTILTGKGRMNRDKPGGDDDNTSGASGKLVIMIIRADSVI
jgi:hypothetical protein